MIILYSAYGIAQAFAALKQTRVSTMSVLLCVDDTVVKRLHITRQLYLGKLFAGNTMEKSRKNVILRNNQTTGKRFDGGDGGLTENV